MVLIEIKNHIFQACGANSCSSKNQLQLLDFAQHMGQRHPAKIFMQRPIKIFVWSMRVKEVDADIIFQKINLNHKSNPSVGIINTANVAHQWNICSIQR